jgi:hypothetical protein
MPTRNKGNFRLRNIKTEAIIIAKLKNKYYNKKPIKTVNASLFGSDVINSFKILSSHEIGHFRLGKEQIF